MTVKVCTTCLRPKPLTDFHAHPKGRFGRHPKCKQCRRAYHAKYFKREKTKILRRQANRRYELGGNRRHSRLCRMYGITKEQVDDMFRHQNGCCAICSERRKLCIDHDHKTNIFRGLLCAQCNSAIGLLREDSSIVQRAYVYIEKWRKAQESHLFGSCNPATA